MIENILTNVYFSDIQRALLPKHGHKPGTPYTDAPSIPRRGWMTKVIVNKTNGKQSLCVIPDVGHKATIPDWRDDIVSTHPEAAEG